MIIKPSKRLASFPEYIFSKLNRTVADVEKQSGRKVLNFGIGSPDIKPSEKYIAKLVAYIHEEKTHLYPGYNASPIFSHALITWYKNRFGVELKNNELLPLLGGKDGISHLPLAMLDENDEVLIPDPGYPAFSGGTLLVGAKPVLYDVTERTNFKPLIEELEQKVSPWTKYIWINFPSNPTGQTITLEELEPIVHFAKKHNIFIVYDNAYSEIAFNDFIAPSIFEIKGAKDIAVEIGSFSKMSSFAGYRMGWITGNKDIIAALAKVKSQMDSGMWMALQKLGTFTLTNRDNDWQDMMIENYKSRRDIIAKYLKKLGLRFSVPKAGLYIWAKIPDNEINSEKYCMRLLQEKQILFAPGTAFGNNGKRYVRVCFSANIDSIENYF